MARRCARRPLSNRQLRSKLPELRLKLPDVGPKLPVLRFSQVAEPVVEPGGHAVMCRKWCMTGDSRCHKGGFEWLARVERLICWGVQR
jgi:hypothetical protein